MQSLGSAHWQGELKSARSATVPFEHGLEQELVLHSYPDHVIILQVLECFVLFSVYCSTTAANEAKVTQKAGTVSTEICPKSRSSLDEEEATALDLYNYTHYPVTLLLVSVFAGPSSISLLASGVR